MTDPLLEGAFVLVLCTFWLHMLLEHWGGEDAEKAAAPANPAGGNREEEPPQGKGGGWAV